MKTLFDPQLLKGMPHLPLALDKVSAGFPSPAENYMDASLDLNKELVQHPSATFFVKVEGDSMQGAGIINGDVLIVDRSLEAQSQQIVVAVLNGEFTVKRFFKEGNKISLRAENENYPPIEIEEGMEFMIWGVVTAAIHQFI